MTRTESRNIKCVVYVDYGYTYKRLRGRCFGRTYKSTMKASLLMSPKKCTNLPRNVSQCGIYDTSNSIQACMIESTVK